MTTSNKHGGFTLEWTLEIARGEVFVAEVDCTLDGEWSLTDGDFEIEVDGIIISYGDASTVIRRPKRDELRPDCLAVVLFAAVDADWDKISQRVRDLEV